MLLLKLGDQALLINSGHLAEIYTSSVVFSVVGDIEVVVIVLKEPHLPLVGSRVASGGMIIR